MPRNVSSDGRPKYFGRGAGGDDQGVAGVFAIVAEQVKGPLAQFDPIDVVEHDVGIEAFCVTAHALHQRRALQMLDVAGPIVHIGGRHELAALFQAGDEQGMAIRPRRVNGGGITCRTRPQDQEWTVPDDAHV